LSYVEKSLEKKNEKRKMDEILVYLLKCQYISISLYSTNPFNRELKKCIDMMMGGIRKILQFFYVVIVIYKLNIY
jgi:phosphoenolpyruvate synthase/pyruvate phosphate dikinase